MSHNQITIVSPTPTQVGITARGPSQVAIASAGTQGLSAYQIWLAQGNAGSEQDFINALASGGITPGAGFKIVGAELRHDISSLARG